MENPRKQGRMQTPALITEVMDLPSPLSCLKQVIQFLLDTLTGKIFQEKCPCLVPSMGPPQCCEKVNQLPDLTPPAKEAHDEGSCWPGLEILPFIWLPPISSASHRVAEGIGFLQAKISI